MKRHYFMYESTYNVKRSELELFTMFYNELVSLGFTSNTTIAAQCVDGNVPTFTFTWKNGKSFKMYRDAAYDASSLGNWYLEIDGHRSYWATRFSRYGSTMQAIEEDKKIAFHLIEDDANFIIEFGGFYSIYSNGLSGEFCGWMSDDNKTVAIISTEGSTDENNSRALYNRALFYSNSTANVKRLRLPAYSDSMAIVSDLYLIGSSSDFSNPLVGSITGHVPHLLSCSYVNKWSKISFEGKTYFALDCNTLVEID